MLSGYSGLALASLSGQVGEVVSAVADQLVASTDASNIETTVYHVLLQTTYCINDSLDGNDRELGVCI